VRARETGGAGERERGDWVRVWRGVGLYKAGMGYVGRRERGFRWAGRGVCGGPRQTIAESHVRQALGKGQFYSKIIIKIIIKCEKIIKI
jgi:hypothetical protein